jgi:hypothetical protein
MATGPGDEPAAAGRDRLRAGHADRDHAIEMLKAAFVQGMLVKDEFDARVSQAFASRTNAGLAALTADLPAGPARPPVRIRRRPLARAAAGAGGCLTGKTVLVTGGYRRDRQGHRHQPGSGRCPRWILRQSYYRYLIDLSIRMG